MITQEVGGRRGEEVGEELEEEAGSGGRAHSSGNGAASWLPLTK